MPFGHSAQSSYLYKIQPDNVTIHHGGCLRVIEKFLKEGTLGYRLERGELGLQVAVNGSPDWIRAYTLRAYNRLDVPAFFRAEINPNHLLPAQGHEAGLPASSVPYLKNVDITVLPIKFDHPSVHTEQQIIELAHKEWNSDLALADRIWKSAQRRKKGEIDYSLLPFLNEQKTGTRPLREEFDTKLKQLSQEAPAYFTQFRHSKKTSFSSSSEEET
jgi:hypothetical protein